MPKIISKQNVRPSFSEADEFLPDRAGNQGLTEETSNADSSDDSPSKRTRKPASKRLRVESSSPESRKPQMKRRRIGVTTPGKSESVPSTAQAPPHPPIIDQSLQQHKRHLILPLSHETRGRLQTTPCLNPRPKDREKPEGSQPKRRRTGTAPDPSELFKGSTESEQDDEAGASQQSLAEEDEGHADHEHRISQQEVDDLRLSNSPSTSSKTTRQDRKQKNIDTYTQQRRRKQAGLRLELPEPEEGNLEQHSQDSNLADDEGTQENGGSESAIGDNFIAPDSDADSNDNSESFVVDDVQYPGGTESTDDQEDDRLGPNLGLAMRQFVQGIVKLAFIPDILVTNPAALKDYLDAKHLLESRIETFLPIFGGATWIAPFKYTLDRRGQLNGPTATSVQNSLEERKCDACYSAGTHSCRTSRMSIVSTAKGFYDPETFMDVQETSQQYGTGTAADLKKRTEAQKMLYPPCFPLVIGERCASQASQYHYVRHRLYHIAQRIRHEVEHLREQYSEYNEERMLETLDEDQLAHKLWGNLQDDLAHSSWEGFRLKGNT
ncbi:hypothetical protein MIND_01004100 [Mycena indigotica]|uniref:DUF4211 domain-containing protein n=1 Tax=Mycena indigotica TaxID=2126181 RepID=A0A8H6S9M0_9AGAR|nr:uncharacterized protein MIND_01004100 [Mycena indigotica]KAF7294671.1 hypothetical protein MIND_01004100 [Mycena indigotica]